MVDVPQHDTVMIEIDANMIEDTGMHLSCIVSISFGSCGKIILHTKLRWGLVFGSSIFKSFHVFLFPVFSCPVSRILNIVDLGIGFFFLQLQQQLLQSSKRRIQSIEKGSV